MSDPATIICKATRWFIFRVLVMLLMFSVFAVLFYVDGSTGYRKKNEAFYLRRAFLKANNEFSKMNQDGKLTPEAWKKFALQQWVDLPQDRSVLPVGQLLPMQWPDILHDYERMKPMRVNLLWREYTKLNGMHEATPDEPYDARKIKEQWVVFWICSGLSLGAAFVLLRTLRRTISADADAITDQRGRRVPYADLKSLDLRKWETKGLAFVDFEGSAGSGRLRIDGLTYGGFRKEDGQPAEMLMQLLRSRFSGVVIEYAPVVAAESAAPDTQSRPESG